jgi:hypothetical protein
MATKIYRQGDVLLMRVRKLPAGAVEQPPHQRGIVLAFGEVTGHAHVISPAKAKMWSAQAERYVQMLEDGALTHEEHSAINLPKGVYAVVIQTEYTPQALRRVED